MELIAGADEGRQGKGARPVLLRAGPTVRVVAAAHVLRARLVRVELNAVALCDAREKKLRSEQPLLGIVGRGHSRLSVWDLTSKLTLMCGAPGKRTV